MLWLVLSGVLGVAAIGIAGRQWWLRRSFERGQRTALAEARELRVSRDQARAAIAGLIQSAEAHRAQADSLQAVAAAHAARDRLVQKHRDSLAAAFAILERPTVADTVVYLSQVVTSQQAQITALRDLHAADSLALVEKEQEVVDTKGAVLAALQRVEEAEVVSGRLAHVLARADPPCRILWKKCPSRRSALLAGAVLGAVGTVIVVERRR